jgi:hypothetical protein
MKRLRMVYFARVLAAALLTVCAPLSVPAGARAEVVVTEATVNGIDCFRITTDAATYLYDKAGAALAHILDRDGFDWVGFRPVGSAGVAHGKSGWFRGVPNLGKGGFGHTGWPTATSTTRAALGVPLPKVTIASTYGDWSLSWDFYPTYARMRMHQAPEKFWLLYEGTPGGRLGADDMCWRADGAGMSCGESWAGDIVNTSGAAEAAEWVFFADGTLDRSLFFAHPDDAVEDSYFSMGAMTVFGFGRPAPTLLAKLRKTFFDGRATRHLLERTPDELLIGFVESRDFDVVKAEIDRIYEARPVDEPHELDPDSVPVAATQAPRDSGIASSIIPPAAAEPVTPAELLP